MVFILFTFADEVYQPSGARHGNLDRLRKTAVRSLSGNPLPAHKSAAPTPCQRATVPDRVCLGSCVLDATSFSISMGRSLRMIRRIAFWNGLRIPAGATSRQIGKRARFRRTNAWSSTQRSCGRRPRSSMRLSRRSGSIPHSRPSLTSVGIAAIDLTIVSDGFDRVLRAVLEREQVSVRFFANRLEWQGGDRWKLAFPYAQPECLLTRWQLQVLAWRRAQRPLRRDRRWAIGLLHGSARRLCHRQGGPVGFLPPARPAARFVQHL